MTPPLDSPLPPPLQPPLSRPILRPTLRFMLSHPAHLVALGFGCGLAPFAPGTVGTLWAWFAFALFDPLVGASGWGFVIAAGVGVGWWASTVTARNLASFDPSPVVIDEILAFWTVLWLVMPTGFWGQLIAFTLFRVYDAAKPGPVAWADAFFKPRRGQRIGWAQGFGVLFDDGVAALCTLLTIAVGVWFTR